MNKRNFLKSLGLAATIPFVSSLTGEEIPRKYHKITKDWSFSCASVEKWNNMEVYSKTGLSKEDKRDEPDEFVLLWSDNNLQYDEDKRRFPDLYINGDKYYKIENFKSEFVKPETKYLEVTFDIIEYLGQTPKERIIILPAKSSSETCTYVLGTGHWVTTIEDRPPFGVGKCYRFVVDSQRPLPRDMQIRHLKHNIAWRIKTGFPTEKYEHELRNLICL